jgi:signal transduction histidine kinase
VFGRLIFLVFLAARLSAAEAVLDTVAKVRALSPEEAARKQPVRLEGTIICFDPNRLSIFLSDGTDSTYVGTQTETPEQYASRHLEPGSRVRIAGVTAAGEFFPVICQQQIELLGKGSLPEPRKISATELLSPSLDSQWVEVPAVITGVEKIGYEFTVDVEVFGYKLKAILPRDEHSAARTALLMQRPVRLQGIAGTVFNKDRQMTGRVFYVPSFDQIIPTDPLEADQPTTLRAVNQLLRNNDTAQTLVRVAGIVTQIDGNDFYLRDVSGSTLVSTSGKDSILPGDLVEVEGFAGIAPFRPMLRARKVTVSSHTGLPQPMTLDIDLKKILRFHDELVEVDAELLIRRDGSANAILQCRTGDMIFEALLPPDGSLPAGLAMGDRVRLAGICELTTTYPVAVFWNADGFRLHLPKTGGVVILHHAPWWTFKRVILVFSWIFGFVVLVALGVFVWGLLLRRQVKVQTGIIGNQLQREAVQGERQRIARELHDTVEQELASISMQLDNITTDIKQAPAPIPELFPRSIDIVQKMLQHCRLEARSTIQELRNIELEQRGLGGALQALLPPVTDGCGADFQMQVTGEPRPLARIVETHLLRIAQEGVANAAHHAAARMIQVQLDYTPAAVTLTIHDDGRGLDPAAPVPHGHFGLCGIRERANKLEAALDIKGAPGKGTTIRVVVPTNHPETITPR